MIMLGRDRSSRRWRMRRGLPVLSTMWTKAGFGQSNPRHVIDDFVALPFTAGDWDGWSPFYTVHSTAQVTAAERSLLRGRRPAWLASNVDSILWTLPGEVLEKGHVLFEIAQLIAKGGRSGRLVNVTPNVIARYARILSREPASKAGSRLIEKHFRQVVRARVVMTGSAITTQGRVSE